MASTASARIESRRKPPLF
ncbi:hypothetical protein D018_4490A, partial [Vibrio parahaemolyticus VP2007-007]